jgi:hypothetical protein
VNCSEGHREWIEWNCEKSGREEIRKLAETGGRKKQDTEGSTSIWKPSFMVMPEKQCRVKVMMKSGNRLTLHRGGEGGMVTEEALPTREIKRMREGTSASEGVDPGNGTGKEEEKKMETFEGGISAEGEFAFTKPVVSFCRVAKKVRNFEGNFSFSLKAQMKQMAVMERQVEDEVKVVLMGGSQACRLRGGSRNGVMGDLGWLEWCGFLENSQEIGRDRSERAGWDI